MNKLNGSQQWKQSVWLTHKEHVKCISAFKEKDCWYTYKQILMCLYSWFLSRFSCFESTWIGMWFTEHSNAMWFQSVRIQRQVWNVKRATPHTLTHLIYNEQQFEVCVYIFCAKIYFGARRDQKKTTTRDIQRKAWTSVEFSSSPLKLFHSRFVVRI